MRTSRSAPQLKQCPSGPRQVLVTKRREALLEMGKSVLVVPLQTAVSSEIPQRLGQPRTIESAVETVQGLGPVSEDVREALLRLREAVDKKLL